jgi:phosphoglycerate dehydrogenase-like enzyme
MTLSVHYLWPSPEDAKTRLLDILDPGISLSVGPDVPVPPDTEILIAGRPSLEHLAASPKLHTLIIPWSGLPDTTRDLLLDHPHIAVYNIHHNAAPVAELAFTLLLAAAKFILPLDRSLRANDWRPRYRPNPSLLLKDKTALIMGYGAIGRRLARLCQAIGMTVLATKRNPAANKGEQFAEVHPPKALPQLLRRANVLLICLPLTPETKGLIGAEELAMLPPGAVLVNVGRGLIVDERALFEALRDGGLHSAGLDVWYNYPSEEADRSNTPPSTFPFHELDNVVMSPHRGGATNQTNSLRMNALAGLLNKTARGESLPNRVDLGAGY